MSGKGGDTTSSTVTNKPPQEFLDAYKALMTRAKGVADAPLQQYTGPQVAGFTDDQNAGMNLARASTGMATPFINAASDSYGQSTQPIWENAPQFGQAEIDKYSNPWTQDVIDATMRDFDISNRVQQQGVIGNAIDKGAWGGDRASVAQALTAGEQSRTQAPILAGLRSQGYTQAVDEFNKQQQAKIAADEANSWLASQAGTGYANLGNMASSQALLGANTLLGIGGQQQQLAQQALNVPYEQFLQRQAYPFQTTSWLGNLVEGLGGASGGTSTTSQPAPSPLNGIIGGAGTGAGIGGLIGGPVGAGIGALGGGLLGVLGNIFKRGGRVHHAHGGGVVGYAGGGGVEDLEDDELAAALESTPPISSDYPALQAEYARRFGGGQAAPGAVLPGQISLKGTPGASRAKAFSGPATSKNPPPPGQSVGIGTQLGKTWNSFNAPPSKGNYTGRNPPPFQYPEASPDDYDAQLLDQAPEYDDFSPEQYDAQMVERGSTMPGAPDQFAGVEDDFEPPPLPEADDAGSAPAWKPRTTMPNAGGAGRGIVPSTMPEAAPVAVDYKPPTAEAAAGEERDISPWMALIKGSAALMASRSPRFGQALGNAASVGIQSYMTDREKAAALKERRAERADTGAFRKAGLDLQARRISDAAAEAKARLAEQSAARLERRDQAERFHADSMDLQQQRMQQERWQYLGPDQDNPGHSLFTDTRSGKVESRAVNVGAKPSSAANRQASTFAFADAMVASGEAKDRADAMAKIKDPGSKWAKQEQLQRERLAQQGWKADQTQEARPLEYWQQRYGVTGGAPAAGAAPEKGGGAPASYATAKDVAAAYQSGKLTREQAAQILRDNGWAQ